MSTGHFSHILRKGSDALDKTVLDNIKKIFLGIGVYDCIGVLVLFVIRKASFSTIGGLIAGSAVSIVALLMLAKNIIDLVGKDKGKASLSAMFGYVLRVTLYAAILVFAAVNKSINIYTVAAGLISTSVVIKVQHLILKKTKGKEE